MQNKSLLEQYFHAANAHDVSATLEHFATDAVVRDEDEEHQGAEAIRKWLESTNAKYNTRYTVLHISGRDDSATVLASVSGTFPGSPVQLKFNFIIQNGKITGLECGV